MPIHPCRFFLALCLLAAPLISARAFTTPPPPADGVHYYVSATAGDDDNPGTSELPFRTIGRIAPFIQPGQTCVVRAGVYRELLRPANNGTAEQPITFMAAPGENVVVTGLDAVTGWTPATDAAAGTWRAVWPSPLTALQSQVFFDGAIGHMGRWPNRTNDNLIEPQGAAISAGSDATKILATSLPAGLPADTFDGGNLWVLSGKKWSSWRSPVTGFNPATKTITYQTFPGATEWPNATHLAAAGAGNVFYVCGGRNLVDVTREWYYNPVNDELLVMPPAGFDPATSVVEMQTRFDAIDLSSRSFIIVKGFKVVGSAVNLLKAQHCTAEGITINYPTAERSPKGTNWASGRGGVSVSGSFNTVRECTISWSWNNGIIVSGIENRVINNLISDANLLGTYAAGLYLDQACRDTLVAWNTVRRTGRDCVILNGRGHRFVHNDISGFGSICDDGGGTYSAGQGSDSLIAYNWVHDAAVNSGMKAGIYLDNYTTGVTVHHNVVWNTPWVAIVLNRPSAYHVVAHNTVFERISNFTGGWNPPRNTSIGTQVVNNLSSGAQEASSLGITATTSLVNVANADMGFDTTTHMPNPNRSGLAAGTRIPGISPVAAGVNPDIGAFQTGVEYPTPGYDATKHPETWFDDPPSPIVQRIDNNIFFEGIKGWTPGPLGTAAIVYDGGWNDPGPDKRNTIYANALSLTGGASVEQVVTDLVPGTVYSFYAFRKASAVTTAGLSVIFPDGREYRFTFDPNPASAKLNWQLAEYFDFMVPAGQTEARVGLWMTGPGTVYFDNVGLMQKWLTPGSLDYRATRFTKEPADLSVIAGGDAQFTASSALHSYRTNSWEWRPAGSTDWLPLTSSTDVAVNSALNNPSVTLNPLRPEFNGALFRAVTRNYLSAVDGNTYGYHAYSRPAAMTVTGVSLDHDSGRVGVDEHAYTVAVNLPAGVPWKVEGLPSWVSASATSGSGPGVVTLVVEPNTSGEKREAVIRIAGREHLVRQSDGEIFAEWVMPAEASQREPTSVPAGDGVPNLLKYALSLDHPLDAAEASQPRVQATTDSRLEFVFARAPRRTDLRYVVRASDSLSAPARDWPIVAQASGREPFESLEDGFEVQELPQGDVTEVRVKKAVPAKARFYVLEVLLDDAAD